MQGRKVGAADIELIRDLIAAHPTRGRTPLSVDSTITSVALDRLLHHGETVLIEGSSFRMKDRIET